MIHAAYDMQVVRERDIWRVNVEGTRRLLESALEAKISQTIVLSSMSAFSSTKQLYGRAKLEIEGTAARYGAIVVRPGLVIGAKAGGMAGVLAKFTRLPVTPTVGGAGHQFLIEETDFADAIYSISLRGDVPREPLGLAYPEPIPFPDVLKALGKMQGRASVRLVPVPWKSLYALLRLAERLGLKLPIRSDSLLGLVRPAAAVPGAEALATIGINIPRPLLVGNYAPSPLATYNRTND